MTVASYDGMPLGEGPVLPWFEKLKELGFGSDGKDFIAGNFSSSFQNDEVKKSKKYMTLK